MDTRSFHRHSRDIGFPCLLRHSKSKQIVYEKFLETFKVKQAEFYEKFEDALKVERTVSDSKRGAPSTSQPDPSQSSRKK